MGRGAVGALPSEAIDECGFDSRPTPSFAIVAQQEVRLICNQQGAGSIPADGSTE